MSHGSESGFARGYAGACPLLLECNSRGEVLWMSERTRSALGATGNLAGTITGAASGQAPAVSTLRFCRVWEAGDSVLISAQPAEAAESGACKGFSELLHLQANLMRHNLRLQLAERDLWARAWQKKRGAPHGSGRGAIRQIEWERQRLGRELHTGVGQLLAAIRLQLEIIASQSRQPPGPVGQALEGISTLANEALEQVRSISQRLHPPEWQRLTLEAALQQLWDISGIPQRFEASLRLEPLPREPNLDSKVLLYRGAQEALSNVARHAGATRVDAALEARGGLLVLTIRDNGVGFDAAGLFSSPPSVASGIGLRSVREQAAALGGKLEIESGPLGTKLEVSAPFSPMGP